MWVAIIIVTVILYIRMYTCILLCTGKHQRDDCSAMPTRRRRRRMRSGKSYYTQCRSPTPLDFHHRLAPGSRRTVPTRVARIFPEYISVAAFLPPHNYYQRVRASVRVCVIHSASPDCLIVRYKSSFCSDYYLLDIKYQWWPNFFLPQAMKKIKIKICRASNFKFSLQLQSS